MSSEQQNKNQVGGGPPDHLTAEMTERIGMI